MGTARLGLLIVIGGISLALPHEAARGQIRYLTVRAPKSPLPAMGLLPVGPPPSASTPPATQTLTPTPPAQSKPAFVVQSKPSLDKEELEKRVVAFQQQRSEAGSASAQYELGMRYAQGRGVEKDLALARKWLKLSAAQGSTEAESALAKLPNER